MQTFVHDQCLAFPPFHCISSILWDIFFQKNNTIVRSYINSWLTIVEAVHIYIYNVQNQNTDLNNMWIKI